LKEGRIPPDVRVKNFSNVGELYLSFTKKMVFPSNFTEILNDRSVPRKSTDTKSVKNRSLVDLLTGKSLLNLSMNSYVSDTISDNFTNWTVT